jgi:hypothetical protein
MTEIYNLLKRQRFQLHNEKALQSDIEQVLISNQIQHDREYRFSNESIIDFMVGGTGIEVKISSSAKSVFRQIERYLAFDEIDSLLLVTNKIIVLPRTINNKSVLILNIGIAWL